MSFFDKLGKTVTDTANSVVEKTKSSTDTIRLNNRISEEERNINAAFLSIGKKYVELHPNDAEAAYSEYLDTIVQSQQKIAEYQEKLKALEAQKTEAENLEIVQMVRALRMTPTQLSAMLSGGTVPGSLADDNNEQEENSYEE